MSARAYIALPMWLSAIRQEPTGGWNLTENRQKTADAASWSHAARSDFQNQQTPSRPVRPLAAVPREGWRAHRQGAWKDAPVDHQALPDNRQTMPQRGYPMLSDHDASFIAPVRSETGRYRQDWCPLAWLAKAARAPPDKDRNHALPAPPLPLQGQTDRQTR